MIDAHLVKRKEALLKGLDISLMTLRDIKDVHEIETRCFTNPWPKGLFLEELTNPLSHPYTARYISEDGSKVMVGYVIFWVFASEAHILNIAVDPPYRGMGIGRRLIEFVIGRSEDLGFREIFLEVRRSNTIARHLYEDIGFSVIGVRSGYYSDNKEDAIVMAYRLGKK